MPKAKQQHYTPAVYLRGFTSQKELVYCHMLENQKEWWAKPEKLCRENNFYGEDEGGSLEGKLSKEVESPFGPVRDKLLKTSDVKSLNEKERQTMLRFVAFQLERTSRRRRTIFDKTMRHVNSKDFGRLTAEEREEARREADLSGIKMSALMDACIYEWKKAGRSLTEEDITKLRDKLHIKTAERRSHYLRRAETGHWDEAALAEFSDHEMVKQFVKNVHNSELELKAEERKALLNKKRWVLFRNDTDEPFITSDNPATIHQENLGKDSEPVSRFAELIGQGSWDASTDSLISIALPLSPKFLLMFLPSENGEVAPCSKNTTAPDEWVKYFNRTTGMQAHCFLISATEKFGSALEGCQVKKGIEEKLGDILPGLTSVSEKEREKSKSAYKELLLMIKGSGMKF